MSASFRRMQPCDGSPGIRFGWSVPWIPTIESSGKSVSLARSVVPNAQGP